MEAIRGLERLISIWTERNVYEATFLVKLHKCLGEFLYTVLRKTVFVLCFIRRGGRVLNIYRSITSGCKQID